MSLLRTKYLTLDEYKRNFATTWVVLADELAFFMSIKIFIVTVGTPY